MTEQQWQVSTDPSEMYAFVKDRVTERQRRDFIAAVEYVWSDGKNDGVFSYEASRSSHEGVIECLRIHNIVSDIPKWADLLREIIGNPFPAKSTKISEYTKDPAFQFSANPEWLTWSNATVPNLIRAMMEEECNECQIIHGEHSRYVHAGPDSCWEKCSCNNGYVTRAEPQWEMMPILGDALEEAGCAEAAILDHLRGTEPCPHCDGEGARFYDEDDRLQCKQRCDDCNGTGKRLVRHVKGCWCVELLMEGMK